jgi:hypothetical protein
MAIISNGTTVISGGTVSGAAPTTAQVASATAGISADAVGSYALLGSYYESLGLNFGSTRGGTNLVPVNVNGGNPTASQNRRSGTWRCMGYVRESDFPQRSTLWLRIS